MRKSFLITALESVGLWIFFRVDKAAAVQGVDPSLVTTVVTVLSSMMSNSKPFFITLSASLTDGEMITKEVATAASPQVVLKSSKV